MYEKTVFVNTVELSKNLPIHYLLYKKAKLVRIGHHGVVVHFHSVQKSKLYHAPA